MDHNLPSHLFHPLPRLLQQNNATRLSVSWALLSEYTGDIINHIGLSIQKTQVHGQHQKVTADLQHNI
jgi:hypothetical protein